MLHTAFLASQSTLRISRRETHRWGRVSLRSTLCIRFRTRECSLFEHKRVDQSNKRAKIAREFPWRPSFVQIWLALIHIMPRRALIKTVYEKIHRSTQASSQCFRLTKTVIKSSNRSQQRMLSCQVNASREELSISLREKNKLSGLTSRTCKCCGHYSKLNRPFRLKIGRITPVVRTTTKKTSRWPAATQLDLTKRHQAAGSELQMCKKTIWWRIQLRRTLLLCKIRRNSSHTDLMLNQAAFQNVQIFMSILGM